MGIYDQPAVIDYVLEKTQSEKTFYVGKKTIIIDH